MGVDAGSTQVDASWQAVIASEPSVSDQRLPGAIKRINPPRLKIEITYQSATAGVSQRLVTVTQYCFHPPTGRGVLEAWCHTRGEDRTFLLPRIIAAVDPASGKAIANLIGFLEDAYLASPEGRHEELLRTRPKTLEQTKKADKRRLFAHAVDPHIAKLLKRRFFDYFGNRCFKCHTAEKPREEMGSPPILCMDHHIPANLGGHLELGNLVALCRRCNSKKGDKPPEEFYSRYQLEQLQRYLDGQRGLFAFELDCDRYFSDDQETYLRELGVDEDTLHRLYHDPNDIDYRGLRSERMKDALNVCISVDMSAFQDLK